MSGYDEELLDRITGEAAEAIEQASIGRCSWQRVTDVFATRFPGCFAAILNNDFVNDRINFMESTALDPDFAASYADYYITVNRWADYWRYMPSGSVFVSEDHLPAAMLAESEFYNDWLKPLDRAAGIGLKADASPTDLITIPVQFPLKYAAAYTAPSAEISRRLHAPVMRAVEAGRLLRQQSERSSNLSALSVAADTAAFVVDSRMRLQEANNTGMTLMSGSGPLAYRDKRIVFAQQEADQTIADLVGALCTSPAAPRHRHQWRYNAAAWAVRAIRLQNVCHAGLILPTRQRVLLMVREIKRDAEAPDLSGFAALFHLTPAEMRLCGSLAAGSSLAEAAVKHGIANETARHHINSIFSKTETHRQAELVALMARHVQF